MRDFDAEIAAAASELAARGATELVASFGVVSARVVRFRWGSSVLEVEGRRPDGVPSAGRDVGTDVVTSSRTRVRRDRLDPDELVRSLARTLAELARP